MSRPTSGSNNYPVFFSFTTPARLKSDKLVRVPLAVAMMRPPKPVVVFTEQEAGLSTALSLPIPRMERDESMMVIVSQSGDMMTIEQEEEEKTEDNARGNVNTERLRLENGRYTGGGSLTRSLLNWLNSPL